MRRIRQGFPASEGLAHGPVHKLEWGVPIVPHTVVDPGDTGVEVERFHEARRWTRGRLTELQSLAAARLGSVEARIFDPQLLMLDDPAVIEGTLGYITENHLPAARAFEWRMRELQSLWTELGNPLVLDKLNDVEDLRVRMVHRLLGENDPLDAINLSGPAIVLARNLTPSLTIQLDAGQVLGIATDEGTRTAHWVILAKSLSIPAVVGLRDLVGQVDDGEEMLLDARTGRVVVEPTPNETTLFESRWAQLREWEVEVREEASDPVVTLDGVTVELRANLDLPTEAAAARDRGADGVGLVRTEFLVVGRSVLPDEEEQYQAYRQILEAFRGDPVCIRTFDLGGDKFPMFLHMPREENPFLGWRAIRVCLDQPGLFRTQLRALVRAGVHGDLRIMIPMVNTLDEIRQVRDHLEVVEKDLAAKGTPFDSEYKLGILVETPAAALDADALGQHVDFLSIGTNDLVQYTLAVDRTSARLSGLYDPFHPSVVRQLAMVAAAGKGAGIEVSVCGEMAANPIGAFLFLGLGIHVLSVAWPVVPEVKRVLRSVRAEDARAAAGIALKSGSSSEVMAALIEGIGDAVDLAPFRDP